MLTFLGGAIADKVDQKRLLLYLQLGQGLLLAFLATLCVTDKIEVWHILAIAFSLGSLGAFEQPARQALFPTLVDRSALTSAVALNSTVHPGTRIIGPVLAGVLLASISGATHSAPIAASAAFYLAAAGHVVWALFLHFVHTPPVRRRRSSDLFQDMAAGVSFIRRNHVFGFLISMTYFNNFFALSAFTLFPAFAKDILHVGPSGLGLLYTAIGIGNLIGVLITANLGNFERRGWLILGGTVIEAGFLVLFAVSSWFAASLVLLGLAGIGSSIFNVSAQSTLQVLVPDDFRGRVMGIWGLTHSTFQPLGQMQMGTMAALFSPPFAVILGAGMVIAFAIATTRNQRIRELGIASTSQAPLETAEAGSS